MSNAEESLNTKFRSTISHALLGSDCDASRETWELVFTECEKIAKQHTNQTLQELKAKIKKVEAGDNPQYQETEYIRIEYVITLIDETIDE